MITMMFYTINQKAEESPELINVVTTDFISTQSVKKSSKNLLITHHKIIFDQFVEHQILSKD